MIGLPVLTTDSLLTESNKRAVGLGLVPTPGTTHLAQATLYRHSLGVTTQC